MTKRHKIIIQALRDLGGKATLKQVSEKTGLSVNGLSQSIDSRSLNQHVKLEYLGGKGGERMYELKE